MVLFAGLAWVQFGGGGEDAARARAVTNVRDSTLSQPAVWDGFDQLEAATKGHPCLEVAFTDRYFEG